VHPSRQRRSEKKLDSVGGRVILCNIDPQIYEVFDITDLKQRLPAGVQAAGLPSEPFLAEAFRQDQAAYWASLLRVWLKWLAVPVALLVVVLLLGRLLGWW
jgi:hypothetical protein